MNFTSAITLPLPTLTSVMFSAPMYATVEDGDLFMRRFFNSNPWTSATRANKLLALATATQYMDRLNYKGEKTDAEQTAQFPRDGNTSIPLDIRNACILSANAILDGIDTELEYSNLYAMSLKFETAQISYSRERIPEHLLLGIPSILAFRLIKPYLASRQGFSIKRAS